MYTRKELQEHRDQLSAEELNLLQKRLSGKFGNNRATHSIPRRPDSQFAPLSFLQERLWFLFEWEPDSPSYNEAQMSRIEGQLDLKAFEAAYLEIARRHEILRTTYQIVEDRPVQVIAPAVNWSLSLVDLSGFSAEVRDEEMQRLAKEEANRPFDLKHELSWRVFLVRLVQDEHIVLVTQHHISCDGWSIKVRDNEFAALYAAFVANKRISLPELPIQYADFAYWQRQQLRGEKLAKSLDYWKTQLADLTPLQLPINRPRPKILASKGATLQMTLSSTLTKAIDTLSQQEKVTSFVVALTAFKVLLCRYAGQTDIAVGSTMVNRDRPELEGLIGFLIETIILRTDLSGNLTFRDLIHRVHQVTMEAYAHKDVPFTAIATEVQDNRDSSRMHLAQVFFEWQDLKSLPSHQLEIPNIKKTDKARRMLTDTAKFDLSLFVEKHEDKLVCWWEFNTDLFESDTITRMIGHFETLLAGALINPDTRLVDLPLLTVGEQEQLLVTWNDTSTDFPLGSCFHELFEAQVKRTPDAIAAVCEETHLTYRQLDQLANRLASVLIKQNITHSTIALFAERSLEFLISILGIFKAGGAYLPLDPHYPVQRLRQILTQSQCSVVLSADDLVPLLSEALADLVTVKQPTILSFSETQQQTFATNALPICATPDHLAYIIYTSGSTGIPKGAMVEQRGMVNHLYAKIRDLQLTDADIIAQTAPQSFDISVWQFLVALLIGGRVQIFRDEIAFDPARLPAEIAYYRVTTWETVPSLLRAMLEQVGQPHFHHSLTALRWLIPTGEALPPDLACQWHHYFPNTPLINAYGPTECSDDVTHYLVAHPPADDVLRIPIGRPIANMRLYVLDSQLQPVPMGVAGELYVGGVGVGRGYLYNPKRTSETFIPDPFSLEPGARLYKTGDLVCHRPDENLEFLGRIDNQVKVRGHRIELGEIEAVLSQHTAVREAVVVVREDKPGHKQLVVYVVLDPELLTFSADELRYFLRGKLPDYMVPTVFVMLDVLPLTPNGKVNRKALPAPDEIKSSLSVAFVPPRQPIEVAVASTWADVLELEQVGIYDNFFELGGHSLLATQVVSRLRHIFQIELPLRQLFAAPTVADLALIITQARRHEQGLQTAPIVPVARDGFLPLSFAQQRLWFLDQLEPDSPLYNMPDAIRMTGSLSVSVFERSLNEIIRRHETLRTAFTVAGEQPVQVILPFTPMTLPVVDLQSLPEKARETEAWQLATAEAQRPFNLVKDRLFRAVWLQLAPDEQALLTNTHHIISDGWSTDIFSQELRTLYRAFSHGNPSPLPDLPVQYADFACWQQQWLQGDVLERQMAYWQHQLHDLPLMLLPTDRPRPPVQTSRGDSQLFTLPETITKSLKQLSNQEGATLFMTLLAAFQVLLARYTGQEDIIVGSPIANRNHFETEKLIGFFVNALVLRADLSGNPTFRELLDRVREVTLDAYDHQDLPFEKLVEELQPERDLSHNPLFQVVFVFEKLLAPTGISADLALKPMGFQRGVTKFDLTLFMIETEQGLSGVLEYNIDLFMPETIAGILAHFQVLLEGIVANPNQRLADLPLLTTIEKEQLLIEWNKTSVVYAGEKCIHELFESQVERTPDAVAVIVHDSYLTYAELNSRANQLAHYLRLMGVGPEVLVGICVERSIDMIIGLLGILKAGGGYVPLDPAYPRERLAFMLADAHAPVLLTQQRLLEQLPPYEGQAVCLDTSWQNIAQMDGYNRKGDTAPGNLAYIIYTSGSTGQPKGVAIEHHNAAALIHWATDAFGSDIFTGTLAATSICFDLSVFEMFVPLSCGGTIIIAETVMHLPDLPAATAVSLVNTVPSAMKELVRLAAIPDSVQVINLAGELLSTQLVQQIYQQRTIRKVFDLYGPSEDTTYSTFALRSGEKPPTIGRPIANTQLYLLDGNLNPVPVGVPGEVYISGAGLARGYLGHPDLTAEKFIPNPFTATPGDRLYRTGDQARYHFDGNIEFLGRRDYQVKVRGYRIELEEIAASLKHHPAVQDTVVVARDGMQDHKQIIAYVLPDPEQPTNDRDLHRFLQEKLPDYMLPTTFVMLKSFPLMPNGKVNRRALPAPDESRIALKEDVVLPRTPIEEAIVGAWANVLELEHIGIYDNFFELGGHSLLATQVISRLRNIFQVKLPLRQLFAAPTVADLAMFIAEARHTKPNLPAPPILPAPRHGFLPLSFAQQRLWFLDQLEPNSSLYNMPNAVRLTGYLSVSVFAQSLNEIIRRHEILRTTFAVVDAQPVQVIAPFSAVILPVVDLQSLPETAREAEVQRWATVEAQRPFNLVQGPLFRAIWLQLTPDDQLLFTNTHHIISDGWSVGILAQELRVLYHAFSSEVASPLKDLPIQYVDFALWQQQWLQGEVWEAQMGYWRQQLADLPSLSLPTDYPRPSVQTFRGESELFVLPETLARALQQLSNEEGVTLFMFLLAAFQLLLARYTGLEDIAVGSPIANRNHFQTEKLIGLFVNTLVLRTNLSGNPTFRELLARVREVTLSAYDHQELPFEKLVEELRPERVLNRNPLFQVLFIFNKDIAENSSSTIFDARPVKMESGLAELDLTLSIVDTKDGIIGSLEYTTDLFNTQTIERMVGHFQELLVSIVANPDQRVSALSLLSEREQQQLLVAWNDTTAAYPPQECLHELFAAQAARTPEATALVYDDTCLTYRELDQRANQLAHYLQQQGVGVETLVAVCLERSLELVVALLGILKAGGGYVPLDPAYPPERLRYILEDSGAPLLLTSAAVQPRLPATAVTVVCLESVATAVAAQPGAPPPVNNCPAHVAYVIYTSGSTGQPKGSLVSHAAIGNHLSWMQGTFPLHKTDAVLQKTPISFDVSVWEIYGPLVAGARLVLAQADDHQDSHYLVELIKAQQVSVLQLVPSLLQMLLRVPTLGSCTSIQRVFCGGEALPAALIERFHACLAADLYNMYGPTEAAIDTTYWACAREWVGATVPIGRPIANVQVYVLDRQLQPVPVGVPGELHVGGAGLARGYHQRPGLTAAKFIPHPFSRDGGARLYQTGDLARYRADGNLEFLGRIDHQVKVRGYRIELGEIEAVLSGHTAVQETIVVLREDAGGDQQLVAYVVAVAGQAPGSSELRHFLQQALPAYMVPAIFIMLNALPLTPNGKIDRRALPSPDPDRLDAGTTYVAPGTPLEEQLAGIWSQLLGIEQVGIHDNFFELGGHSLLATQVVSRLREILAVELPLRQLFEAPTVAGLAALVNQARQAALGLLAPPILPVSRERPLPLSFAQERLWFLDQLEPHNSFYNIPVATRLSGPLSVTAVERGLNALMARHETLRTSFAMHAGQPVQVVAPLTPRLLPVVDLQALPERARLAEAQQLVMAEAQRPFDLGQGPLWRVTWLVLAADEHILLTNTHHIISDAWSAGIFFGELTQLYQAFHHHAPPELAPLPVQYADFAVWQRQWLQSEVLEAQMAYWRQQLAYLPVLELPTDRPRPPVQTFRGASQAFYLPKNLTGVLKQLSKEAGTTLFMTLLAAFQALLTLYTGQEDIVVGTPIANRNRFETEGLIGFFVNTLLLRTDLSGNPSFREVLHRVQDITLEAYDHQDLPFEKLVEELQPVRDLSRNPLFQVMFMLDRESLVPQEENGAFSALVSEPLLVQGDVAKFDLTWGMNDTREGIIGEVVYNTDLFDAETIERMVSHFQKLLADIAVNPDQRLADLQPLTAVEQHQLLVEWNATRSVYPPQQCLHELFAAQAEQLPDALAVVDEDQYLTYRALNRRANQLAHYLQQQGVGPETLVGVCLERSLELVVALLGILKAGGGYVPLDPSSPPERFAFILADAQASILLTRQNLISNFQQSSAECQVISLDTEWPTIAACPASAPTSLVSLTNVAYVIYTSGSTGQPKGVVIPHQGVRNLVNWHQRTCAVTTADRATLVASPAFDASVWEMWPYLAAGACLHIPDNDTRSRPRQLIQWLANHHITITFLPTPLAEATLQEAWPAKMALRLLLTGGDKLRRSPPPGLPFTLINNYGPTENSVVTTWTPVSASSSHIPPIGRPVDNTQAYLFDRHGRLVPIGVFGELYISGDGLAHGYLNRPALTAEKFVPHPFSDETGARLYKTGDLMRYLPDGNLEFWGRIDGQVKVRGFRIELGEIDSALTQHPAIHEAVTTLRSDTAAGEQLITYLVTADGQLPPTNDLRHFLQQTLPAYMVPSVFIRLEAMPLTTNGKIDLRALPMPERTRPELESGYVAPRTLSEEMLANIWSQLLGIDQVGIHDDFFELGGHSMLAIQLMAQIQDAFQIELTFRLFFQRPTIAELAIVIDDILLQEIEYLSEEEAIQHLQGEF